MASHALENLDPKTDQKLRSVHNTIDKLKECKKVIKDYIGAAAKMQAAAQSFAAANKGWADAIQRLAAHHTDDLGVALTKLVGRQLAISESFDSLTRSVTNDLTGPLETNIEAGSREVDQFAAEMKSTRARLADELKKLEAVTKKAGKGAAQDALINSMKDYNAKREEIDRFKTDQLHKVFLIERRRFGEVLGTTIKVGASQMDVARTILGLEADMAGHQQLMGTLESLSEEQVAALQVGAERTYQALNTSESTGVTLTESTNRSAMQKPGGFTTPRTGGPPPPAGMPPPPGGMPPPPNFSPGPPGGLPPPPNFSPGPPAFEPPPPMGDSPRMGMGLPKLSISPKGGPPKIPGGGPPKMPGGPPPGGNGSLRGGKLPSAPPGLGPGGPSRAALPPPMPGSSPRPPTGMGGGPPAPMGTPPPMGMGGTPPPMGMGGPPPPMGGGGGGPPPPPPGGAPKAPKASSSSSKSKPSKGGGGGKSSGGGGGDSGGGRGGLLDSISGFKGGLKKTVTNDRSAPITKETKTPGGGRGGPPMF